MLIDKFSITPYLSILLAINHGTDNSKKIHDIILDIIKNENRKKQQVTVFETGTEESNGSIIYFTPYEVIKSPSWFKGSELNDTENNLLITICLNNSYAFYFSEKGMKDEIRSHFSSTTLPNLKVVEMNYLNSLFINE